MSKKLLILLSVVSRSIFAVVPTTDLYVMGQDASTITSYIAQIPGYLAQMNSAMNAAEQVKNLKGLAQLQGTGQALCELCNANDLVAMQNYVNQVNSDLCSQFSLAMSNITGVQQAISSLQGIMAVFTANPKAAILALQQASVATQSATQNTMSQIQMLLAQDKQRELAQEKIAKTQQASMQASISKASW